MMPRFVIYLFALLFLLSPTCYSGTVNLGLVSFDVLIPGDGITPGVNVFDISNFTGDPGSGGSALPPDFPVFDFLTFQNSSLTLMSGGPPLVIPLGDIGPGVLNPTDPVQFPDTTAFTEAIFAATLSQTSFTLSGGSTFTAGSTAVTADLVPSSGSSLVAGTDFALVSISDTPEPSACLLAVAALAILYSLRRSALPSRGQ